MAKSEEVKKMLVEMRVYQEIFPKSERPIVRDELARKICQLFEPKPAPDIPLGATCHYERDKDGRWWIVWSADFEQDESGRKLVEESILLEMGYQQAKSELPKPDESRLLLDEEILEASQVSMLLPNGKLDPDSGYLTGRRQVAKAQRDLTASIKEAEFAERIKQYERNSNKIIDTLCKEKDVECQARVERIFKVLDKNYADKTFAGEDWWQALKKQEGIE